ncbi:MAG: type III-B CRISPR module RAMP protein Cmr6 [Burkholderiaceae bacterium]|nr:type III-B CRISPR module RAMP protein Cmr6 [Burkholderiaceae bacterium]
MGAAAAPAYLRDRIDRADPSPATRFGLLLDVWDSDWKKSRGEQSQRLRRIGQLSRDDTERINALVARQRWLAAARAGSGATAHFAARSTAPFATGLGNEHPLENGFSFLAPYGIPYLAGSGVKGVLRSAACELVSGDWGASTDWATAVDSDASASASDPVSVIEVLFGSGERGSHLAQRGVLEFWDVIPKLAGDRLAVEVMTPHQGHYYHGNASPHDSGSPIPIFFLTVPSGSEFGFHVVCDAPRLSALAPALAANARWKGLLREAFEHAFSWLGFGAKTAVGYGAMAPDPERESAYEMAQRRAAVELQETMRRSAQSAAMNRIDEFVAEIRARAESLRGTKDRPNTAWHQKAQALAAAAGGPQWTPEERDRAFATIAEWLPKVVALGDPKEVRKALRKMGIDEPGGAS